MDGNEKIKELEKHDGNLRTIYYLFSNQLEAIRHLTKTFALAMRPVSVFGFQMKSRAEHVSQRIKAMQVRRREKKIQVDRVKRRTPGRKEKLSQITTAAFVKARDIAKSQARVVPHTTQRPHPMHEQSNEELKWHPVWFLTTSESKLYHWLGVDRENKIVQRIVRKEVDASGTWRAPNHFRGQLNDNGPILPLEWITHTLASNAEGGQRSILPIFGKGQTRSPTKSYVIYVQYAAYQTLEAVKLKYRRIGKQMPKPFLYYVFQMLVEAAMVMKQGSSSAASPAQGWTDEIIHRDLKPDNILLDVPDGSHFPIYPRPLVGDFGLSFLTSESDETNPYFWARAAGTHGFMPPEATSYEDSENKKPVDDFKMLSPCNVWGIGATMLSLMEPKLDMDEQQPTYVPGGTFKPEVPDEAKARYGNGFCRLVSDCLNFEPDRRLPLRMLQERIAKNIDSDPYMKNANAGRRDWRDDQNELQYSALEDGYRLGLTYHTQKR